APPAAAAASAWPPPGASPVRTAATSSTPATTPASPASSCVCPKSATSRPRRRPTASRMRTMGRRSLCPRRADNHTRLMPLADRALSRKRHQVACGLAKVQPLRYNPAPMRKILRIGQPRRGLGMEGNPGHPGAETPSLEERLERGDLVHFPLCPFPLPDESQRTFLFEQTLASSVHKNISY